MKKYKVRGVGTEFLQEVEIEAKSEELAKEEFQNMWENGELHAMDYELEIKTEEK